MADIDDIATRIAGIILSPESVNGLINGAFTVPLVMGYMVYGVFDTGSRFRRETARIRMAGAIRNDILNYDHIIDAIKIIFTKFNIYVTETEQDNIYRGVITSFVGRMGTNTIMAMITAAVLERVSFISATFKSKPIAVLTGALLIGGMTERSIRTTGEQQERQQAQAQLDDVAAIHDEPGGRGCPVQEGSVFLTGCGGKQHVGGRVQRSFR
ncbi:hypothetical protein [Rahnella aquatilis]|uniref:hypothetical protein n=1 Tax=Rahnella aquatilis TaxID=34038 RepID=UPI0006485CC0|nr:hypothetical protein [Rahnella aquatilis]